MFELAINSGHVIDPKNQISAKLNLGISGGKIACISNEALKGAEEIDAKGLIVAPGFIDIHMHEDPYNAEDDSFKFCIFHTMLKMGVTSSIGGNCGLSVGHPDPLVLLNAVGKHGFPINFAMLAPHDALRKPAGLGDFYRSADKNQIDSMCRHLEKFLEGGCIGFSLGLQYIPGTSREEAAALMKIAGKYKKVTSVHIRNEAKRCLPAVEEIISICESSGAPLQISHVGGMCGFGQMADTISLIDSGKAKGLNLQFDCYPYYAYCSFIGSAVFDDGFLDDLDMGDEGYEKLEIASGTHRGERCTKESFHAIRKSEGDALVIAHVMKVSDVDMALTHPGCIVISDGIYTNGQGHPRGAGTFPRFIHEYVVSKKMLSLEEALRKITWAPAQRFGIKKGTLSLGADADITIFDLNKIKDGATFMEPVKAPEGIEYVIIGAKTALKKGQIINDTLGKPVRL